MIMMQVLNFLRKHQGFIAYHMAIHENPGATHDAGAEFLTFQKN